MTMELPLPSGAALSTARQVFWLSAQPEGAGLPTGVNPGSGHGQPAPSVPDYSGGTAPDLHRVPECLVDLLCCPDFYQPHRTLSIIFCCRAPGPRLP